MKTKEYYIEKHFIPHLGTPDWDSEETKQKAFDEIKEHYIQGIKSLVNLLDSNGISVCTFSDEMQSLIVDFEYLERELEL